MVTFKHKNIKYVKYDDLSNNVCQMLKTKRVFVLNVEL